VLKIDIYLSQNYVFKFTTLDEPDTERAVCGKSARTVYLGLSGISTMEEKTYFTNTDGLKLCGILTKPQKETERCIILCHGITATKDEDGVFVELAKRLADNGFTVFRFDFRGHGESEGDSIDLTVTGEKKDLEAAVKFLQDLGYRDFGITAASFGGGAVSLFISENEDLIKALVLWNAIIDYHSILQPELLWPKENFGQEAMKKLDRQGYIEIGSHKFKVGKALFAELRQLKPWKGIRNLEIPILFIHGDKDSYVPYEDSLKYSKLFKNAKLETIKGGEHGFHDNKRDSDKDDEAVIQFFLEHI